ncbi:MAG: DUF2232 domain-containing protein [Pseudomonadota bacterium]
MGCVGTAIILLLASAWIPFLGPFFSLLTPLPFLYYASKLGPYQGLKVVIFTLLIVGLIAKLTGYLQVIFFCIELGLLGLIISTIYRRELTFGLTIFWGTSLMLFIGAIFLSLISFSKKMGPMELILAYLQNNLTEAINTYENMGVDQERIIQVRGYGQALMDILTKIYPSLLIIGTGFVVWVNVIISKPLFRIRNLRYPQFGPLDHWRAPEMMVWGFIAAGFSLFLFTGVVKLLSINAVIVMSVIYVFHGLSILLFILNKYRIHPLMRFLVYFLIVFQQIFLLGLFFAGLFDQWLDFRKLYKRSK